MNNKCELKAVGLVLRSVIFWQEVYRNYIAMETLYILLCSTDLINVVNVNVNGSHQII